MKSLARDGDKEPYTTRGAVGVGGTEVAAEARGKAVVEAMTRTVGQA
jgi:hypothetical protein